MVAYLVNIYVVFIYLFIYFTFCAPGDDLFLRRKTCEGLESKHILNTKPVKSDQWNFPVLSCGTTFMRTVTKWQKH